MQPHHRESRTAGPLDAELAREAKAIVALAFRNGPIEDLHAGIACPTCQNDTESFTNRRSRARRSLSRNRMACFLSFSSSAILANTSSVLAIEIEAIGTTEASQGRASGGLWKKGDPPREGGIVFAILCKRPSGA
jgi:hypothetical protein